MSSGALPVPFGRRKTVDEAVATIEEESFRLKKDVGALDVLVLGVGVIVGAGIFVLTGVAAATEAGPSLDPVTWLRFGGWMLLGLVVYAVYSRRRSVVGRREGG